MLGNRKLLDAGILLLCIPQVQNIRKKNTPVSELLQQHLLRGCVVHLEVKETLQHWLFARNHKEPIFQFLDPDSSLRAYRISIQPWKKMWKFNQTWVSGKYTFWTPLVWESNALWVWQIFSATSICVKVINDLMPNIAKKKRTTQWKISIPYAQPTKMIKNKSIFIVIHIHTCKCLQNTRMCSKHYSPWPTQCFVCCCCNYVRVFKRARNDSSSY